MNEALRGSSWPACPRPGASTRACRWSAQLRAARDRGPLLRRRGVPRRRRTHRCTVPRLPGRRAPAGDIAAATRTGSPVRVVRRVLNATETLLPFLLDELRAERPAAVAFDSTAVWGRMAAAELGLPMISLMTTIMIGDDAFDRQTLRERLRFIRSRRPGRARYGGRPAAAGASLRGAEPPADPAVPDARAPHPVPGAAVAAAVRPAGRPELPLRRRHGRSGLRGRGAARPWAGRLAAHEFRRAGGPGVAGDPAHGHRRASSCTCLEVLAELPVRGLLVVGAHGDPARLGPPPENVLVRRLSSRSPRCCGGPRCSSPTAAWAARCEALSAGVPLVVVPQQVEQSVIGRPSPTGARRPCCATTWRTGRCRPASCAPPSSGPAPTRTVRAAATALASRGRRGRWSTGRRRRDPQAGADLGIGGVGRVGGGGAQLGQLRLERGVPVDRVVGLVGVRLAAAALTAVSGSNREISWASRTLVRRRSAAGRRRAGRWSGPPRAARRAGRRPVSASRSWSRSSARGSPAQPASVSASTGNSRS